MATAAPVAPCRREPAPKPLRTGKRGEPPGSGPAAFHNNCLWTWGPLHTAPAVNRRLFLYSCLTASLPANGTPAQGRRVLPVAFPEAPETSGKATGFHSYAPVARHRKSGSAPLCGKPRQACPNLQPPVTRLAMSTGPKREGLTAVARGQITTMRAVRFDNHRTPPC